MISSSNFGWATEAKKDRAERDRDAHAARDSGDTGGGSAPARRLRRRTGRCRAATQGAFAALSDHGRAWLVGSCGGIPEICRGTYRRRSGRLARAVDRLDLRRKTQARRLGLPGYI